MLDEVIKAIKDGRNVCITGGAGVGKSYLSRQVISWCKEEGINIAVTATTGMASLQLDGGETIHRCSGINILTNPKDLTKIIGTARYRQEIFPRLRQLEIVLIDEMSMMRPDTFELLDLVFRDAKGRAGKPFGGTQLIMVGDFCLKNGTEVMLFNGRIKPIEDIQIGDQLMGMDNTPRPVLRKFCGVSPLIQIKQSNGMSYSVTPNHKITVKNISNSRYQSLDTILDLTPQEYNAKSNKFKEYFRGFKAGQLNFPAKDVLLDPYFVGLWLGDGEKCSNRICSADREIMEYLESYASILGVNYKKRLEASNSRAYRISLLTENHSNVSNPIIKALRYYEIFNNKHIPEEYLYNTVECRLQLLAGLLDTDGNLADSRFTYSTSLEILSIQVKLLADQLGFRTSVYFNKKVKNWIISINGEISTIPTRIKRKIASNKNHRRHYETSSITISDDGVGNFTGIELDGDNRFLLADGTVTHNCQLPPVMKDATTDLRWVFQTDLWKSLQFKTIVLKEIKRQSDEQFMMALRRVRAGLINDQTSEYFNQTESHTFPEGVVPLLLMGTNEEVDRHNSYKLSEVDEDLEAYDGIVDAVDESFAQQIRRDCLAPEKLHLKVGCQVMILKNDKEGQYVNGSMGIYRGYERDEDGAKALKVELFSSGEEVALPIYKWKIEKHLADDKTIELASFKQYPIKLAYAITVHKSQGMSLDYLEVNMLKFFAPGQAYVALSRARTYEGLRIKNWNKMFIKADSTAFHYYMNLNQTNDDDNYHRNDDHVQGPLQNNHQ